MENSIYTVDYFLAKFQMIPDDSMIAYERHSGDKHCAHGWCDLERRQTVRRGAILSEEEKSFVSLAHYLDLPGFAQINNGVDDRYPQPTPKTRILAALEDIKKLQQPEPKVIYRTIVIDSTVKELSGQLTNN